MGLYIISLVFLIGLIILLINYFHAKNKNKKEPGSYSEKGMRARFIGIIVLAVLTVLPLIPIFGVLFLFSGVLMYIIPFVCFIGLIIMLISYFHAKKKNKEEPDTYSKESMRIRLIIIIILAIFTVLPIIGLFGFILLMNLGIFGM